MSDREAELVRRKRLMPAQRVKFYQVGSFAAGNRLLAGDQQSVQAGPGRTNSLNCGHRAC
jgi:pyruvate ferredoxin oxidoreductase beta subunit